MLKWAAHNMPKQDAKPADSYANQDWIAFEKQYPEPDECVLVKMDDGSVTRAQWKAGMASWSHSPFEKWGVPVSWSPLPPLHRAS
jgi:hypothetical protein